MPKKTKEIENKIENIRNLLSKKNETKSKDDKSTKKATTSKSNKKDTEKKGTSKSSTQKKNDVTAFAINQYWCLKMY